MSSPHCTIPYNIAISRAPLSARRFDGIVGSFNAINQSHVKTLLFAPIVYAVVIANLLSDKCSSPYDIRQ